MSTLGVFIQHCPINIIFNINCFKYVICEKHLSLIPNTVLRKHFSIYKLQFGKWRLWMGVFYLFIFRQGGREGERQGDKDQCMVAFRTPHTLGTWPATQACALTGSRTNNTLVLRLALSPLSHTSQGHTWHFLMNTSFLWKGSSWAEMFFTYDQGQNNCKGWRHVSSAQGLVRDPAQQGGRSWDEGGEMGP